VGDASASDRLEVVVQAMHPTVDFAFMAGSDLCSEIPAWGGKA
jgi:nicotinic acid mononucleotide adenylyltransferase